MEHRILRNVADNGEIVRETIWADNYPPSNEQIDYTQQLAKSLANDSARGPFRQDIVDTLAVQKRRNPSILGWKTIRILNIFSDTDRHSKP